MLNMCTYIKRLWWESAEDKIARNISEQIEQEIQRAKKTKPQIRLLLLGPAESGKSTVIRQIRILHNNGFSETEINERRFVVYSNTVRSMFEILCALQQTFEAGGRQHAQWENAAVFEADCRNVMRHVERGMEFSPIPDKVRSAIHRLWRLRLVQHTFETRQSEWHMNENAKYFFEHIDRIALPDYRPTNEDILRTRMPTTGIVRMEFRIRNLDFRIIDVGGQRTQRRKWIHFFDDTNVIIFVAAINEYDQTLREDNKMNGLLESLALFDNIANCVTLCSASIVLFLNKKDLFKQKIDKIPLNKLFPSYQGGPNYKEAVLFLRNKFHALYQRSQQRMYSHITCATDTQQLERVFDAVLDTIIQENIRVLI